MYTVFREAAIPIFLETRELPVDPLHITADVRLSVAVLVGAGLRLSESISHLGFLGSGFMMK